MEEIWKVYKISYIANKYGYRGIRNIYEVSNLGRVKRNDELVKLNNNTKYYKVGTFCVHRAVAELFIPNHYNKPQVDHINRNTHDNRVCNLRWVTPKENMGNENTIKHLQEIHSSEEYKVKFLGENNNMYGKNLHVWVTNGTENHLIKIEFLDKYLSLGYERGLTPHKKLNNIA